MHNAVAGRWLLYTTLTLTAIALPSEVSAATKKIKGDTDLSDYVTNGTLSDDIKFEKDNKTLFIDGNVNDVTLSGVIYVKSDRNGNTIEAESDFDGTVSLSADNSYNQNITLRGGIIEVIGSGRLGSGNFSGAMDLGSGGNTGTFKQNSSSAQTFSSAIIGTGSLIKDNTGTLTLSGSNTYTGSTVIDGGILEVQGGSALSDSSAVTVNSGGTLEVDNNETIGRIGGAGNLTLNATLITGDTTDTNISGNISGTGGLTKQGASTMELTGSNTYTGTTTVNDGTLRMVNSSAGDAIFAATAAQQSYVVGSGATLEFSRSLVNGEEDGTKTIKKFNLSGAGTFKKTGDAELRAFSNSTINMSSGALFHVESGIFTVGGNNNAADWSGNLSDLQVESGASIDGAGGAMRVNGLNGAGTVLINGGITLGSDNGSGSFSGAIANSALGSTDTYNLTKEGSGTQTLSGANTYTGDTTISSGTLEIGGAGSLGSGSYAGAIANSGTFKQNSTADQTLSGVISGTGSLVKDNSGTLTLTGSNTYAGDTTVNAGTLRMVNSAAGNGIRQAPNEEGTVVIYNYNVASGATLEFEQNGPEMYNINRVNLSGGGTFKKTGSQELKSFGGVSVVAMDSGALFHVESGTFTFGANVAGNWSGNRSGLQVDTGATFDGAGTAIVVDALNGGGMVKTGGGLNVGIDNGSGSFSGVIANSEKGSAHTLTKSGSGTQTLSGANTFSGDTTISGGTLEISGAGSLGSGTYAGAIANSGTFKQNSTADQTLSGVISGTGSLVKDNSGTQTLSGANTYTGDTTISGGTLEISGAGSLGSGTYAGAIVNSGTFKQNSTVDQTLSGVISGTGALVKDNSGTLTLTGDNTYSGGTTLNAGAGTLVITGVTSAGTGAIVQTDANSILRFDTTGTITNNMTLYNFESLRNVTLSGDINSQDATYKIATGKDTILSGNITGTGKLSQIGADDANYRGTLTLSGDNDFDGDTEVDSVLNVGSSGALSENSKLKVNNGGMVKLNGFDSTVAGLEGNGTIQGSAALTAGDENDAIFSGILQDGDGAEGLSLMKKGSGKMTLSGANTFSGNTTLDEGSLEVKNAQALGTGSLSQTDDSSSLIFDTTGTVTNDLSIFSVEFLQDVILSGNIIANNATYNVADGVTSEVSGDITGTGGTTKLGLGTQVLSGNNTYTGANDVQAGTLRAGSSTAFGTNSATTVASGAVLELDGFSNSIGSLAGAGTVENASATAATLTTGGDNTSTAFSGVLQDGTGGGALSLTKTGSGTQTLTGINTYTGATTISAGTLEISGTGQLGSGTYAGAISNSGTFNYNSSANQTLSGVISGSGGLTKTNTGTLTLTGTNTYTGDTTLSAGTLVLGNASAAGTGTITQTDGTSTLRLNTTGTVANNISLYNLESLQSVTLSGSITANNATYDIASGTTTEISGAITGTGGTTKEGLGTLLLSGDNTYTGNTEINAGTLSLSSSTSNNNINDSVSIIVGSDGTFDVSAITASGGFQLANGQTLAGTGDVNGATQMTAGSNLSAGDSGVGTLSFLSSLDVANASTGSLLFDLGSAGTGDLIDVTGQLSIGDGQLDLDSFAFTNLGATSVTGTYTWDLFQVGSFDFTNLGSNTTDNIFGSYSATLAISGGNVVQLTMFVPEPSSTALLGLGGLMLALRRKR